MAKTAAMPMRTTRSLRPTRTGCSILYSDAVEGMQAPRRFLRGPYVGLSITVPWWYQTSFRSDLGIRLARGSSFKRQRHLDGEHARRRGCFDAEVAVFKHQALGRGDAEPR